MDLSIRPARQTDVEQLWSLCHGLGLFLKDESEPSRPQQADVARFRDVLADGAHFAPVAALGSELVGYALAQDYGVSLRRDWSVARLHDLYVTPETRGRGIGRRLHEHVVEWCRHRPVRFLEWQASEGAVEFYERLGYRPDREGDFAMHPFFEHEFS